MSSCIGHCCRLMRSLCVRSVCEDTVTGRFAVLSPHRCLRSWSERRQTRAGLFLGGTQTSPDSTIRCVARASVCPGSLTHHPCGLSQSFLCDLFADTLMCSARWALFVSAQCYRSELHKDALCFQMTHRLETVRGNRGPVRTLWTCSIRM